MVRATVSGNVPQRFPLQVRAICPVLSSVVSPRRDVIVDERVPPGSTREKSHRDRDRGWHVATARRAGKLSGRAWDSRH